MKCYGDDLAAVGVPDNQDRASELWNELKDLWERYETAHSEYFDSVNLSQSKLDSLHEQHEEHRGDFAQDTIRRYLPTGLSPRGSPRRTPKETPKQQGVTNKDLDHRRQEFLRAYFELERLDIEWVLQKQQGRARS